MRPVEVVFTVSEEVGLMGARALDMSTLRSSTAVVLDSAGGGGHHHQQRAAARPHRRHHHRAGRPTPASLPKRVSVPSPWPRQAIAAMRLGRLDAETTANIGLISGGTAMNVVPERVTLTGETRSHDPAKVAAQVRHMVTALEDAAAAAGAQADVEVSTLYRTFNILGGLMRLYSRSRQPFVAPVLHPVCTRPAAAVTPASSTSAGS